MKILAIDVGSNSIKSLLAEIEEGKFTELNSDIVHNRISSTKGLVEDAGDIIISAIKSLINSAKRHSSEFEVCIVGTSALRESNIKMEIVRKVFDETGFDMKILSGDDEARLCFIGALSDERLNLEEGEEILFFDLGGGSVEFVYGTKHEIFFEKSLPLGAVRLKNLFNNAEGEILNFVSNNLIKIKNKNLKNKKMVVSGGSVGAIISMLGKSTQLVSKDELKELLYFCKTLSSDDISHKYNININRADIIISAIYCLIFVMEFFKENILFFTQRSLRYGLIISQTQKSIVDIFKSEPQN